MSRDYYPHRQPYGFPRERDPYRNPPAGYRDSLPYQHHPGSSTLLDPYDVPRRAYPSVLGSSPYERQPIQTLKPQVFDYNNIKSDAYHPAKREDYHRKPESSLHSPSTRGANLKVSVDELKNSLGGQLDNLLSKGLGQHPFDVAGSNRYPDQPYSKSVDYLHQGPNVKPDLVFNETNISSQTYQKPKNPFIENNPVSGVLGHPSGSYGKKSTALFPIASPDEPIKPKGILKKSILKNSTTTVEAKPREELPIYQSAMPDTVDEDDYLYGGGGGSSESRSSFATLLSDKSLNQHQSTKSAEEIVSNPAFTALLKNIGLDDINLADRIKEKQSKDQRPQQKDRKEQKSIDDDLGFGIDQNASFLSSGVVLDDLLQLKKPQKPTERVSKESTSEPLVEDFLRMLDEKNLKDKLSKDPAHHSPDKKKHRGERSRSDEFGRAGVRASPERRSHRNRSPSRDRELDFAKNRSPRREQSPRRERSPRIERSPRRDHVTRRERSPRREHSPRRDFSPKRERSQGIEHSPRRRHSPRGFVGYETEDRLRAVTNPERPIDIEYNSAAPFNPGARYMTNKGADRSSTERMQSQYPSFSPMSATDQHSRKRKSESTNLHNLVEELSRNPTQIDEVLRIIPEDQRMTRSQFEELLSEHKRRREISPRNSPPSRHALQKIVSNETLLKNAGNREGSSVDQKQPRNKDKVFGGETDGSLKSPSFRRIVKAESEKDSLLSIKMVIRNDSATSTSDEKVKATHQPTKVKGDDERRVVRRIGAIGSAQLEAKAMESEKDRMIKDLAEEDWKKAFGDEPLLPKLGRQEIINIRQIIEFNKEKLTKSERRLTSLQNDQKDVMKSLKHASLGQQYQLDKTLEHNIRMQNEITAEIKNLKKIIRDDELALEEQYEQERKVRELSKKKQALQKAASTQSNRPKEISPAPEKVDRRYRRAVEDKMMGKVDPNKVSQAKTSKESSPSPVNKGKAGLVIEYYDPGSHWCKACCFVADKMKSYLDHLQSSGHIKKREKIGKPWQPEAVKNPPKRSLIARGDLQPMKGVEFLHPVDSFYCLLCNYFTGDKESVEHHVKSEEHNANYKSYLTDNPMYEKRLKQDKEAGIQDAKRQEIKQREEAERKLEKEKEERERKREEERRLERERKEAIERQKKEKLEKQQAKKRAEVLAITRGTSDDEDEEDSNETPQEKIKRELLQKTRAKAEALKAGSEKAKVKAKAAEIEQAVYGPLPPADLVQESKSKSKNVVIGKMPQKSSNSTDGDKTKETSSKTASITGPEATDKPAAAQSPKVKQSASGSTVTQPTEPTVSPFVQKMLDMQRNGEIETPHIPVHTTVQNSTTVTGYENTPIPHFQATPQSVPGGGQMMGNQPMYDPMPHHAQPMPMRHPMRPQMGPQVGPRMMPQMVSSAGPMMQQMHPHQFQRPGNPFMGHQRAMGPPRMPPHGGLGGWQGYHQGGWNQGPNQGPMMRLPRCPGSGGGVVKKTMVVSACGKLTTEDSVIVDNSISKKTLPQDTATTNESDSSSLVEDYGSANDNNSKPLDDANASKPNEIGINNYNTDEGGGVSTSNPIMKQEGVDHMAIHVKGEPIGAADIETVKNEDADEKTEYQKPSDKQTVDVLFVDNQRASETYNVTNINMGDSQQSSENSTRPLDGRQDFGRNHSGVVEDQKDVLASLPSTDSHLTGASDNNQAVSNSLEEIASSKRVCADTFQAVVLNANLQQPCDSVLSGPTQIDVQLVKPTESVLSASLADSSSTGNGSSAAFEDVVHSVGSPQSKSAPKVSSAPNASSAPAQPSDTDYVDELTEPQMEDMDDMDFTVIDSVGED